MGEIAVWARPNSVRTRLEWDRWRRRWVVHCRAAAREGAANEEIRRSLAGWLGVPPSGLAWRTGGRSRAKQLLVEGLSDEEVDARLRAVLAEGE